MKKSIVILLIVALLPVFAFSASNSFIELHAGNLGVKGKNVGVVVLSPVSFAYQIGGKAIRMPDNAVSDGIKHELINKGAKVMVMNPPGMEQVISQFIAIRKGKFSTKEVLTASADKALMSGMKNTKADLADGIRLIEKLLNINELSGETGRIDNYNAIYKKCIESWGIDRLITVQSKGTFGVVVKGYEINAASAALVFQYEVRGDKDNWATSFPVKYNDKWERDGYYITDSADVKYESSYKRVVELVKRISGFLK